ncbi:hypothetical protein LC607_21345 [Nostoc sp. CHAB 5824]|nr:hypothetical protein [Nostoc sp. CHAB 5824]
MQTVLIEVLPPQNLVLSKVKAEVATRKAEVLTGKAEVATDCVKYENVKAEVPTRKAEVATDCAKYENVNPGAIFFDGC